MLINLTHHPVSEWSLEQRKQAEALFGSIVDLPFPEIEPQWSTGQVISLAQEYWKRCLKYREQASDIVVHLMGEVTFCFALAVLLQQSDIPVIASTSLRHVEDNIDGSTTRYFGFVQFRPYPLVKTLQTL